MSACPPLCRLGRRALPSPLPRSALWWTVDNENEGSKLGDGKTLTQKERGEDAKKKKGVSTISFSRAR